jgi:uncharacterized protein (DUF697 family)
MAKKLPRAIRPSTAPTADYIAAMEREPSRPTEYIRAGPKASRSGAAREPAAVSGDARRVMAVRLVKRLSLWAGAAGLIPVPFVDLAAIGGIQIQMLRRLSQLYGVPFSENRGKVLIAGVAGTMIPASSGIGAASLTKGIPLAGMAIGAVAMPALSAGATYAIGMAFIQHFTSGGTLLDFEPPDYNDFIKAQAALHKP